MTNQRIDEDEVERFFRNEIDEAPETGQDPEPFERMLATVRRLRAERDDLAGAVGELTAERDGKG